MKSIYTLIAASVIFSGCASFDPFGTHQPENLNALSYGNDYDQGQSHDGQWGSTQDAPYSSDTNYGNSNSGRSPASVGSASKDPSDSYYEKGKLDPTDESVRNEIERARGNTSNDGFARGDRATREDFVDNKPNDGSLWANENDSNYFFQKGKVRSPGDIISVKMEDPMVKQLAEEIKKSLTPAEQEVEMALYRKNNPNAKDDADLKAYRNIASEDLRTRDAEDVKKTQEKAYRWSQVDLTQAISMTPNEELRAEIIDRYKNGNYKIRATKRVMYRGTSKLVSMVAVAPAADFDDKDLINSGKLYEYKIRVAH